VNNSIQQLVSTISSAKTAVQLANLAAAAATLNSLSDQLTKEVSAIEEVVNVLNLGIQTNVHAVTLVYAAPEEGDFYSRWLRLAYGKSGGQWGFIIEELTEDPSEPEHDSYKSWAYHEAPREFRLKVVEKIPALLDALVKRSEEVAKEITKKVGFTRELASFVRKPSPDGSKK
jgi:hypothetical protein